MTTDHFFFFFSVGGVLIVLDKVILWMFFPFVFYRKKVFCWVFLSPWFGWFWCLLLNNLL